jgi:Mor family transcriptional regulator
MRRNRRYKMKKRRSRKLFSKTASYVNGRNYYVPMRGGIRL